MTAFLPLRLILFPGGWATTLKKPDMVAGRHSSADLRLPLPDVSRRHCRFVFTDGSWRVFDLKSLNGLYVNNERVEQAELHHQVLVRIGSYTFQVDLEGASVGAPLPAAEPNSPESSTSAISEAHAAPQRKAS